jgi:hypothetical protein
MTYIGRATYGAVPRCFGIDEVQRTFLHALRAIQASACALPDTACTWAKHCLHEGVAP